MNIEKNGGVPTEDELIVALAKAFDAPEAAAVTWLATIHTRFDARAAQERVVAREGESILRARKKLWAEVRG